MRGLLAVAVALMVMMPCSALAQSPERPVVELGVQGSKRIESDPAPVAWSLRLTVPLTRRTAIEGTADIQKSFKPTGDRRSSREFSVNWRQTVFASGRLQIFGVLGAGRNRVEWIAQGGQLERPITFGFTDIVAHFGSAVQVELARWLALRSDVRLSVGRDSGVRGIVGAVVPIRRFRDSDRPAESTPPPAAWQRVKPGREVWVRTNAGSLVYGEIAAISNSSLIIRERDREVTIRLDDVRLVEGRDSLKNGFLIGTVPGAVAGGLVFGALESSLCGSGPCDYTTPVAIVLGAVAGAAVGGLIGIMVDGLIPGRQILFERTGTRVIPIVSPEKKAVRITIDWR